MLKSLLFVLLSVFVLMTGCSNDDDPVTPNNPTTGEVLLAEVPGDSVGATSGTSANNASITSQTLNFTDRDSARISFFYSGTNNSSATPFQIFFSSGPASVTIYNGSSLIITPAEQFANITIVSPRVNQFFQYTIVTASSPGFSYFKFRELKIYKK